MGGVKQTFSIQLGFQLLKGHRQVAHPLRGHGIAVELVGAVPRKHGDPARHHYFHAVFRPEPKTHGAALKHDAADGALLVLQGKVMVPGGVHFIVGQLAPDADVLKHRLIVQQQLHQFVDFGNAEDVLFHGSSFSRGCPPRRNKKAEPDGVAPPAPLCRCLIRRLPAARSCPGCR